jgi:short-subunit dehydrogenase
MLLIDRAEAALDETADELRAAGATAAALCFDLTAADAPGRIESELSARELYCDVLVNSAGFGLFGPAAEVPHAEQIELINVNVRVLTALTLRMLPGMIERRRGGVINLGSITGYAPGPNMALYYASKAYVNSFSAALAAELAGSGVTMTCLAPGVVRTPFFERAAVGKTRLFKLAPRADVADVAAAGWRGFKAGKPLVVPRLMDRIIVGICRLLPSGLIARVVARLQRPPLPPPH